MGNEVNALRIAFMDQNAQIQKHLKVTASRLYATIYINSETPKKEF